VVKRIEQWPWPPEPAQRARARPKTYADRLMVKALVIMMIRCLYTAYALFTFLDQDDAVAVRLRPLLCEQGRFPSRRTWERRLALLPPSLPGLIGCCGQHLVALVQPWVTQGRAVAFDNSPLETGGGGAQHTSGAGHHPSHVDRNGSSLEHVGLAQLVVWVEAASGRDGRRGVDTRGGRTDGGQSGRQ
jgi:hypothetical protein